MRELRIISVGCKEEKALFHYLGVDALGGYIWYKVGFEYCRYNSYSYSNSYFHYIILRAVRSTDPLRN